MLLKRGVFLEKRKQEKRKQEKRKQEKRKQIVITQIEHENIENPVTLFTYMQGEKLFDVFFREDSAGNAVAVGDIYLGKIQNIVKNIGAAFVEVRKGELCYLSLSDRKSDAPPLRCGDELVVQVKKEAVKTKQPVVTEFPELVGRYAVVTAKNSDKGISKKIQSEKEKKRLEKILEIFEEEAFGIVLRTNAEKAEDDVIKEECEKLLFELHELMEIGKSRTCFSLLKKEDSFCRRHIDDYHPEEFDRIITDQKEVYEELRPVYGDVVEWYADSDYSLDKLLGISDKLNKALEKKVWLKSGGNLVIEPTEALTVIDVNTGKAIEGKRNKETTFFKINCEAAIEAARQIRVRGLSGIILIDFIDMRNRENKCKLMELLREKLREDKVRASLIDITKLGLVEITRMKKYKTLREQLPYAK